MTSDLYFPPSGDWERREASSFGINQSALERAVQFAKENEIAWPIDLRKRNVSKDLTKWSAKIGLMKPRGGPAGVVIKDGFIVAEWGDVERVDLTYSATKSYLSALVGVAFDHGLINDTSTPVFEYEDGKSIKMHKTSLDVDGFASGQNMLITWEHLLQQTSEWEGTLYTKPDVVDWNRDLSSVGMGQENYLKVKNLKNLLF